MEECRGLLADEVEAAAVVDVVDVVPGDALGPVLLLREGENQRYNWPLVISETGAAQSDAADSLGSEHLLTNLVVFQTGRLFVARAAAAGIINVFGD